MCLSGEGQWDTLEHAQWRYGVGWWPCQPYHRGQERRKKPSILQPGWSMWSWAQRGVRGGNYQNRGRVKETVMNCPIESIDWFRLCELWLLWGRERYVSCSECQLGGRSDANMFNPSRGTREGRLNMLLTRLIIRGISEMMKLVSCLLSTMERYSVYVYVFWFFTFFFVRLLFLIC